ncbi:hypothetical protein SAMN05720606_101206 [Paenibacillus polysaccharolyticus]|uniref:Uncharacterized protein n=2 Tax=Paenibacillus polysaccharolyticus TaxID=582692 RepID=A0A1G5B2X8_9BACL|nr:hypothetical protein SAMN05720606_101206 [Paenibacillus polysaccharolyticus]
MPCSVAEITVFVTMWLTSACEQSDRSKGKGGHGDSASLIGRGTTNNPSLSTLDTEKTYELCAEVLSGYYKAIWNGLEFDVSRYIDNPNLKLYTEKKIRSQYNLFRKNNLTYNQVREVKMEAEKVDYIEGEQSFYYLKMNARIIKDVGEYAESTEFLVQDLKGKVVIVDWYTSGKDSYDSIMRGESQVINNPAIWENSERVDKLK